MTDEDARRIKCSRLIGQAEYMFRECRILLTGVGSGGLPPERRLAVLKMIKDWEAEVATLFPPLPERK